MTPKERLAAKKRDHYQQGSNNSNRTAATYTKGGLDRTNETSNGNPLASGNQGMMEYYKQVNSQIVANDPIKKGGRKGNPNVAGHGGGMNDGQSNDGTLRGHAPDAV